MAEQVVTSPPAQVDAEQAQMPSPDTTLAISADEYMEKYAHDFYEWVKGELIKMTPITYTHDQIVQYLRLLLETYVTLKPIGKVVGAPFVMRVDATESRREPDIQIILKDNPGKLTDTAMIGPADICIEVVSPESVTRDHGEKFAEYEKGGVREYWIIDPAHKEARFYRLDEQGVYRSFSPDEQGNYQTPSLPGLLLHVPTLWRDELPDIIAVVQSVQTMLNK